MDTAAKRAERLRQSRTRAATRHNHHTLRARLAATANIAKSPLGLVDAKPSIAHDDGSDHTDECQQRGDELTTLLLTTKLLQPPSAAEAAKPCGGARLGGCQLQQQSQGGFEIIEMLTGGAPKVRGGRRT